MKVSFGDVHPLFASSKARLIKVEAWGRRSGLNVPGPFSLIYTRVGMIPHLTNDTLRIAGLVPPPESISPWIYQLSLASLIDVWRACDGFDEGVRKYVGLSSESLTFLSIQDSGKKLTSGYNDTNNVSIFGRGGRTRMDVELYNRVISALHLDGGVQLMADTDTPPASQPKRVRKSVERTLRFAERILDKWTETELESSVTVETNLLDNNCKSLKAKQNNSDNDDISKEHLNTEWWGTVSGGYLELERRRCAAQISGLKAVQGFVIDGFCQFDAKDGEFPLYKDVLKQTVSFLDSRPRMLLGPLCPSEVWEAVQIGIDIFDSSYAYRLTEEGQLLRLGSKFPEVYDDYNLIQVKTLEGAARMHDAPVHGCSCYTCNKYTTAYLHHLLNTDELLAPILIMTHNLHQWLGMFGRIRKYLESGNVDEN